MKNGWIKLHRRILENPISRKPAYAWLWTALLLKANHKEKSFIWNGKKQVCKEGQILTGRKELSVLCGIREGTVENILRYLESEQQIEQQKTTKFRLITVKNWKEYQAVEQQNEQQSNNKVTTKEQQNDTNKNDKKEKNDKNITNVIERSSFGNENINSLLKDFELIMGFKSSSSKDRIFGKHLTNNFTGEQLKAMLTFCSTNEYAPRIGSLEKMWFKRGDIIAGLKANYNKSNNVVII